MHRFFSFTAVIAALSLLAACGGGANMKAELDATKEKKAKMAVVSLTVSDFGKTLQHGNSEDVGSLITKKMDEMLGLTETAFGAKWTIVPAASIVAAEPYQKLAKSKAEGNVFAPKPAGAQMPIFAADRSDMVKTNLDPKMATDLCQALGVDLITVVYSEWTTQTGGIIPTTKAYAKTVVSVYDSQGRRLFKGRKDLQGNKTLGAMGFAKVDEESLNVWVGAFQNGLDMMLAEM
ncbi:MAG: hypothetical protein HY901_19865 [Deltaproteobacteria bacterium]|nr:hypothetical protein [Deltaproteobacteria bacterium]